jgi:hypothetical protein
MPAPTAPKKEKSTEAKTVDPEPMKGLTPPKPGYITPKSDDEEYSPVKSVDLGEDLSESQKAEKAKTSARQEEFVKAIGRSGGKSRRKHKKSKKTRKTKKHGKRRH